MSKFYLPIVMTLFLGLTVVFAQSPPDLISYQGIARDAAGNVLSNQPISVNFICRFQLEVQQIIFKRMVQI